MIAGIPITSKSEKQAAILSRLENPRVIRIRSEEDALQVLSRNLTRHEYGWIKSHELSAVARAVMTALATLKCIRERDREGAGEEEDPFSLIPSRSRGLVSGAGR